LLVALFVSAVVATSAAAAAAQEKARGADSAAKEQVYDVEFVFGETHYLGTMTLQVAKQGAVAGKMAIDRPGRVTGDVAGTLKDGALALDYAFTSDGDGCSGRVVVDAKMTSQRDAADGTARATGCGDMPLEGTFSLKKAAKPGTATR
jgi:hypothetical protein